MLDSGQGLGLSTKARQHAGLEHVLIGHDLERQATVGDGLGR